MGCGGTKSAEGAESPGMPPGPVEAKPPAKPTPAADGAQGLQSDDPEVLRQALSNALSRGQRGPEITDAEARLRAKLQIPADWDLKTFCAGRRLEGGLGGRKASTVVAFQPQPPQVVKAMQSVLDGTYRKVYTRDRRGAPIPDRFTVKEVHRVLNDQVWREYESQRDAVRKACAAQQAELPDGSHTVNHLKQSGGLAALPPLDEALAPIWRLSDNQEKLMGLDPNYSFVLPCYIGEFVCTSTLFERIETG
ncbi:unnamed protein product [Durusdinium trenchii]|uniref:Uncharacterized protein n=1 Tax=Durusdinium trenchii TaxID=1381693 RepID=A0ABP0LWG5_9DINO